jgi:hypothetical protein
MLHDTCVDSTIICIDTKRNEAGGAWKGREVASQDRH